MGKSFVYNTGSGEDDKNVNELWCDFGVFIDGTLNNKDNTQLRRKYRNDDENSILTKENKDKHLEKEKEDYENLTSTGLINTPDWVEDSAKFKYEEYAAYLRGIYRSDLDKLGTDNSFSNDDTNVTRMWKCCNEKYRIYVEGMGTADKKDERQDSQDGFAFGAGQTGIRMRVRQACERMADKIFEKKNDNEGATAVTQITIDVFGFSRGAASARNFVHEVNAKKPYEPHEIEIPDGYDNYVFRGELRKNKRPAIQKTGDADGIEINTKHLIDGKMPRLGHLGYSLLDKGVVSPEELENLKVSIRFVGVYDTVSSYYEIGALGAYDDDGKAVDDGAFAKVVLEGISTHFTNDEKELGLQELGDVSKFHKLVHFTAKDEHRRNFALTRINQIPDIAIEKNFPGVHCDIGGAYENEEEECVDEIGTTAADQNISINLKLYFLKLFFDTTPLTKLKEQLIEAHWYRKEELAISREDDGYKSIGIEKIKMPSYHKLTGTRKGIKKEYSYIPLHFMEEYCRQTPMINFFMDDTVLKYPLTRDPFLEKVKNSMRKYVFGNDDEWEFISDAQRQKEEEEREVVLPAISIVDNKEEPIKVQLPEIIIDNLNKQKALRKLRREYLHWSSTRDWFGMEPNEGRVRNIFPKK